MRLREPFQGWKLSSGHFMFHLAYFLGSKIALKEIDNSLISEVELDILYQLNLAHLLVPLSNFLSAICENFGYFTLSVSLDTLSVLQY